LRAEGRKVGRCRDMEYQHARLDMEAVIR
jgi:hypothetical protein